MASLKCSFCGHGIHYHGEPPNGTEYIFCKDSDWQELEKQNLASDSLELENPKKFIKAWKCSECDTFAFFNEHGQVTAVYSPSKEKFLEKMKEPTDFGVFFDDFLWYDITEENIPASKILKKYPKNFWLLKNAEEMRIFEDKEMTNLVKQYLRIEIATE